MKNNINYKKAFYYIIFLFFSLTIANVGVLFNFIAITSNAGKMPFLFEYSYSSNTHFSFQNMSEVNNSFLTDIIPVGSILYSIGDLILYLGSTIMIILLIFMSFGKYSIFKKKFIGTSQMYENTSELQKE